MQTRLLVKNDDPGVHTFTIKELGIDVTVNPGSEKIVEVKNAPAGSYTYICTIAGHSSQMKGTLTVTQ